MLNVLNISVYTNLSLTLSETLTLYFNICIIETSFFNLLNNKADHQYFIFFICEINKAFNIE